MQDGLAEFLDRQLRRRSGLSNADYQVLAHLSEAPEGRLRSFELAALLRWEKSRLSQHLSRMEQRGLWSGNDASPTSGRDRGHHPGSDLIAAARQHVADVRSAFIDQLTPTQLTTIADISETARRRIDENSTRQ